MRLLHLITNSMFVELPSWELQTLVGGLGGERGVG